MHLLCLTFVFFFQAVSAAGLLHQCVCVCRFKESSYSTDDDATRESREHGVGDGEGGNDRFIRDGACMMPMQVEGRHSAHADTERSVRGSLSLFSFYFFLFSTHLLLMLLFTLYTAKN